MVRLFCIAAILLFTAMLCIACSGQDGLSNIPTPSLTSTRDTASADAHQLWGYFRFTIDPTAETIDITPLRMAGMHVNALVFLEPPALVLLSLDYLEFNGNLITADIGLRHPFLGLTEFTGFDVCGVFITNGSISGFDDSDIVMPGSGDTRLLNPDGYARWWNPSEFPMDGTMFGYKDGLLGAPDSITNFNCTINGYKYYADGLSAQVDYTTLDPANRGVFSAGQKNIRRFEIELGDAGFVFNYAIDACWEFPQGDPPWTAPEDFSPNANRVEAWGIDVSEVDNTLFNNGFGNSGGELSLSIDVYDHFNVDMNTVRVESPGNFDMVETTIATGGGVGYSTYEIDIVDVTPAANSIDLLITVECEESGYQGLLTGVTQAAYITHTAVVASSGPAPPVTGNVLLETIRDPMKIITGLRISWTRNSSPEYAVYADTDPYGGLDDFSNLVGTTSADLLVINSSNWTGFSINAAYAFTVRARSQAGSAATESEDSEYCFCELDDFEGGTEAGGGTWISRSYNPAIQFQNSTGPWTVHGGGCFAAQEIRLGRTSGSPSAHVSHWICVISPELPDILNSEEARFEFSTHYIRIPDTIYTPYGNSGDVRVVGCCTTPPTNGSLTIDFDISGPDTDNWLEGFHYDWSTVPGYQPGDVIYNIYGAPSSYHTTLGNIYWHSPLMEYTRYTAWTFYESFETLEGYSDGRRYVGIGYARNYNSGDDCYHDIAYDDIAVILY